MFQIKKSTHCWLTYQSHSPDVLPANTIKSPKLAWINRYRAFMATARRASHLSRLHSQTPGNTKNMPVLKAKAYALRCSISRQLITKLRSNIPIISTEWSILGTTMPKRRSPGAKYIDSVQNPMTEIDYQLYVQGRNFYAGCDTPPDDPLLPPGRVIFGYIVLIKTPNFLMMS